MPTDVHGAVDMVHKPTPNLNTLRRKNRILPCMEKMPNCHLQIEVANQWLRPVFYKKKTSSEVVKKMHMS